jgi:hypothetical protein
MAFSADGALLAVAGSDRAVRLRDPGAGARIGDLVGVREVAVAAGARLVTADDDGSVRIWDAATGDPLHTLTDYIRGVRSLAIHPDGAQLATVGEDGQMWIWDPDTGLPAETFGDESVCGVRAVACSTDGRMIATADTDGILCLRDSHTAAVEHTLAENLFGWVAHVHAQLFGARLAQQALDRRVVLHVCREVWPIVKATVPPAAAVAVSPLLGLDVRGALWLALCVAVAGQVGWSVVAARRAGASPRLMAATASVNLVLGPLIISMKIVLKH